MDHDAFDYFISLSRFINVIGFLSRHFSIVFDDIIKKEVASRFHKSSSESWRAESFLIDASFLLLYDTASRLLAATVSATIVTHASHCAPSRPHDSNYRDAALNAALAPRAAPDGRYWVSIRSTHTFLIFAELSQMIMPILRHTCHIAKPLALTQLPITPPRKISEDIFPSHIIHGRCCFCFTYLMAYYEISRFISHWWLHLFPFRFRPAANFGRRLHRVRRLVGTILLFLFIRVLSSLISPLSTAIPTRCCRQLHWRMLSLPPVILFDDRFAFSRYRLGAHSTHFFLRYALPCPLSHALTNVYCFSLTHVRWYFIWLTFTLSILRLPIARRDAHFFTSLEHSTPRCYYAKPGSQPYIDSL